VKVLLIKDVKSLGKAGEIKEVKDGYGHNFLIAKGFAKLATPEVIRQYEAKKRREAQEAEALMEKLKDYEKRLGEVKLLIKRPLGANGSLFGAVTKEEIANELNSQYGFDIDKKMVEIDKPIKSTGVFDISIKLGHGIHATLNLEVAGE
jgi:large subunit ribosomal protein L9